MFGNPILYGAMRLSELALSFILGSKGLEILKRDTNLNTLCLFQFHFQSLFKNISQYQMPVSCNLHERKYTWHFICPAHIIWDCGKEFKIGREASAKAPNAWSLWLLLHASKALLLSLFFQTSELYVKYLKLRLHGPSFSETGDKMRSQDEKSRQIKKGWPN